MKRVAIVLLIIVLLALFGVGIYFAIFYKPAEQPPIVSGEVIDTRDESEKINVNPSLTQTNTLRRVIDVKMPTINGLTDYAFQENVNKKIAASIDPYINEIAIVADESVPATTVYRYTVTYERYNNDDYLSLVVLQNYATGGMRSNAWKDTYTVDVVRNKEMTLADLCSSKNYKKIIVAEVNKQAKEQNIELVAGNGLADIPDTQRFYIKDDQLYIYFEPASIAPYLDGEMHFKMPFEFVDGKFIVE